jgi:hypothetical protein
MSRISINVIPALYAALNVSEVTDLVTGVHFRTGSGDLPYLVFDRHAPGRPIRTFGGVIAEDDLWIFKAYSDENSSATKSAPQLNAEILNAAETAIGSELQMETGGTWAVERYSDVILPTEERETDKPVYGDAFLLRIVATP